MIPATFSNVPTKMNGRLRPYRSVLRSESIPASAWTSRAIIRVKTQVAIHCSLPFSPDEFLYQQGLDQPIGLRDRCQAQPINVNCEGFVPSYAFHSLPLS